MRACVPVCTQCMLSARVDPYIDVGVVWLPIIIIIVVTLAVLFFVVLPLFLFAAFKSHQRHEEKVIRHETLRQSLRSRSRSMTTAAAASNASRGGGASEEVKRRRPPVSTMVLDITGVTLDESTVDDKRKMMLDSSAWSASTVDAAKKRVDQSSYDDSDLGPVHRSHPGGGYPAPRRPLENEIATVGGRSLYGPAPAYQSAGPGFFNEGYLGDVYPGQSMNSFDDRSIDARFANVVQSALDGSDGAASRGGRTSRPRPQLSSPGASPAKYADRARESPRATDSSGGGGAATSSAASRTKRPRPKLQEYSM